MSHKDGEMWFLVVNFLSSSIYDGCFKLYVMTRSDISTLKIAALHYFKPNSIKSFLKKNINKAHIKFPFKNPGKKWNIKNSIKCENQIPSCNCFPFWNVMNM